MSTTLQVEIAERISAFIKLNELDRPYGGSIETVKIPTDHLTIGFSRHTALDGMVCIYAVDKIRIQYCTNLHNLPPFCTQVFTSEDDVITFLTNTFCAN